MATRNGRRKSRGSQISDSIMGLLIPVFFTVLAAYQQIKTGAVDKYVIGALIIFGLGALGWRLDVFFEAYMNRNQGNAAEEEEPPPKKKKKPVEDEGVE